MVNPCVLVHVGQLPSVPHLLVDLVHLPGLEGLLPSVHVLKTLDCGTPVLTLVWTPMWTPMWTLVWTLVLTLGWTLT